MTYLPDGFKSARKGVSSEMRWKSSRPILTEGSWQARDIAIKCRTAFVEPPVTMTMRMAFSNAPLVIISLGFKSNSNNFLIASPARAHSSLFSWESAGDDEE